MQTQIRLLTEREQSDQGLHSVTVCNSVSIFFYALLYGKIIMFKFWTITANFWGVWFFRTFTGIFSFLMVFFSAFPTETLSSLACIWFHKFNQISLPAKMFPNSNSSRISGFSHAFNIWATSWQNQQNDCAPSEDSDQPGHPPSLIWVFAVRSMGS